MYKLDTVPLSRDGSKKERLGFASRLRQQVDDARQAKTTNNHFSNYANANASFSNRQSVTAFFLAIDHCQKLNRHIAHDKRKYQEEQRQSNTDKAEVNFLPVARLNPLWFDLFSDQTGEVPALGDGVDGERCPVKTVSSKKQLFVTKNRLPALRFTGNRFTLLSRFTKGSGVKKISLEPISELT